MNEKPSMDEPNQGWMCGRYMDEPNQGLTNPTKERMDDASWNRYVVYFFLLKSGGFGHKDIENSTSRFFSLSTSNTKVASIIKVIKERVSLLIWLGVEWWCWVTCYPICLLRLCSFFWSRFVQAIIKLQNIEWQCEVPLLLDNNALLEGKLLLGDILHHKSVSKENISVFI